MNLKKLFITISFLFITTMVLGQGFSYTFTDPCTFKQKQIYIDNPSGSVLLSYNGTTQSFTQQQLQSGNLEQWINQVNATSPSGTGPCGGVAVFQNTTLNALVASNSIAVLTNVMSTMSSLSSMATSSGGSTIQGVVQSNEKVSSNNKKDDKKGGSTNGESNGQSTSGTGTINGQSQNNGNTGSNGEGQTSVGGNQPNTESQGSNQTNPNAGGTTSGNGETTSTSGGNATNPNNTSSGGGTTSQSSVGGQGSGQGQTNNGDPKSNEEKMGEMNKTSNSNSAQVKAKVATVKQGSVMMTGDLVVISSAIKGEKQQIKANMSIIQSNTKNTFAKGVLLNYTSAIHNTCFTAFAAYRAKNSTTILANSSMMNFERDFFNTTSLMESYKFWKLTGTLGVNYSRGNLGDARFTSLSSLGGVVGNFNLGKKMSTTTMFVMVYSPYVYFYEGLWYKSGLLAVPFVAVDYRLTQKFKMNLSFSGVQQINSNTINYQVLLGAKALL
jgi:hypothetical protein